MLNREEIAKAIRGPVQIVDVPEWSGQVGIRRLSAGDLVKLRSIVKPEGERTDEDNLFATCTVLAMAFCDEAGESMFSAAELMEWDGQQAEVLHRLVAEAQAHNGMGTAATEELEKNSASGQTSDST